jgi:ATP phosphoribosyltransferase
VEPLRDAGRRLVIDAPDGTRFITTRPSDVPTYVEAGAADLGIVGKDVLIERRPDVYELVDLGFGACRMVYATLAGEDPTPDAVERLGAVRVATKYPNAAIAYFASTGRQAEVVKVSGSVELAPLVGLAHGIVDLTATGNTLRANGLVEREEIFVSTARLIANRASNTLRAAAMDALVDSLDRGAP